MRIRPIQIVPSVLVSDDGGKTWSKGKQTNPAGIYFSSVTYGPGFGPPAHRRQERGAAAARISGIYILAPGKKWMKQSEGIFNAIFYAANGSGWAVGTSGNGDAIAMMFALKIDFNPT